MVVTFDLPPASLAAAGIREADELIVEITPAGLQIQSDSLRKVYVEATGRCNLRCVMCPRHAWAGEAGDMTAACYDALLDGLPDAGADGVTIAFGGYGEPTIHPRFIDMVAAARRAAHRVEVITNGTTMSPAMATELLGLGVAQVTVSVDGGDDVSFARMRDTDRGEVVEAVVRLREERRRVQGRLTLGLAVVVTRRNVKSMPALLDSARAIGADFVSLSSLVPHTREMAEDLLWRHAADSSGSSPEGWSPRVVVGRMDFDDQTRPLVEALWRQVPVVPPPAFDRGSWRNRCRFARDGMLAVAWDGHVAPCLSLLYSHPEYVGGRQKAVVACRVGDVASAPLRGIWRETAYREFRARVRAFDFSPCLTCGGCAISETNQQDCFGTPAPSCSECLWAQGIVLCP
jgi:MoaA/NifB/PqqE/SkfB family radical SAM enzyme